MASIKLSSLLGDIREIDIDFGGEAPLTVKYRPGGVTPQTVARAAHAQSAFNGSASHNGRTTKKATEPSVEAQSEAVNALVAFLADIVVSWNLALDNDEPVGTDYDSLLTLPSEFLGKVYQEIINAGKEELGKTPGT